MKKLEPAFGVDLKEPAFTDDRWVSPFNWWPEVREQMHAPERVFIHDVTLRDGEQTARIAFTPDEKLFLAQELDKLGVHSIEPGLPVTPEDKEVIKTLATMRLNAKIVPLVRVMESDVEATLDAKADGMLLEFGINPYLMKYVYKKDPDGLIDEAKMLACMWNLWAGMLSAARTSVFWRTFSAALRSHVTLTELPSPTHSAWGILLRLTLSCVS